MEANNNSGPLEEFLTPVTRRTSERLESTQLTSDLRRRGRVRQFPLWGARLLLMMLQTPSKTLLAVCKVSPFQTLSKLFKIESQLNKPQASKTPLPSQPSPLQPSLYSPQKNQTKDQATKFINLHSLLSFLSCKILIKLMSK